jgi:hypothetical protein
MFLVFSTTQGPVTINADRIISYWHDPENQSTEIRLSDGGMIVVLEHPQIITEALETHTCVVPVLRMHIVPKPEVGPVLEERDHGDSVRVQVRVDGQPVAAWETSRDGSHTPA